MMGEDGSLSGPRRRVYISTLAVHTTRVAVRRVVQSSFEPTTTVATDICRFAASFCSLETMYSLDQTFLIPTCNYWLYFDHPLHKIDMQRVDIPNPVMHVYKSPISEYGRAATAAS